MSDDTRNTTREISDWKLERFLLGELDEAEMATIRRAAETDAGLRARLDAMESSGRALLEKYPPDAVGREIRRRVESRAAAADAAGTAAGHGAGSAAGRHAPGAGKWRGFRLRHPVLIPVALAAIVIVAIISHPGIIPNIPSDSRTGTEGTRIKGDAQELRVYRRTPTGSEALHDGDVAAEGDVVRLMYRSDEPWGVILSVDARGVITRHLPEEGSVEGSVEGSEAAALDTGEARFLDHAYELDDAPGWEVFVFVTAATRFPVEAVVRAIEQARDAAMSGTDAATGALPGPLPALRLPGNLHEQRITLFKKGRDGR